MVDHNLVVVQVHLVMVVAGHAGWALVVKVVDGGSGPGGPGSATGGNGGWWHCSVVRYKIWQMLITCKSNWW